MAVLGTKLHVPAPRRELVPRARLTDLLPTSRSAMPRLVLVSAPAGFGKTTLLSQWLATGAELAAHVAWLSLDEGDNDPRRFLAHLVAALRAGNPDGVADTTALVETGGEVPAETVLTTLVNDLDEVDGTTVLTLDDYHVIDEAGVHDAVRFLLEHLPPRATLAMATRADPPLPLARLRSRAELVELRASDLRFTPAEADAFLNQVMGLDINADQVAALDARTEGWAAGLQLAGLSMRGHDQTAAFVDAFTGSHRFVLDYLIEEVLGRQPQEVREFLLVTSVLDRLTGPLCDTLTGRKDGHRLLDKLDRANLFVVPLDDQRQWYRYHHLFADAATRAARRRGSRQGPEPAPRRQPMVRRPRPAGRRHRAREGRPRRRSDRRPHRTSPARGSSPAPRPRGPGVVASTARRRGPAAAGPRHAICMDASCRGRPRRRRGPTPRRRACTRGHARR